MKKINIIIAKLTKIRDRFIIFVNSLFDTDLESFKKEYESRVNEILPGRDATREQVISYYLGYVSLYYKHKESRRNLFGSFFVVIPTLFAAMFFLKNQGLDHYYKILDVFTLFFTWVTIKMFNINRQKVYKKAKQIIAFQEYYDYLPNDFILTKSINFKNEQLKNEYVSTTNLYRIIVIFVLIALIALLFD